MTDEMRWGLAHLDEDARARADRAVFEAIFQGAPGIAVIRRVARLAPRRTAWLFARLTPTSLRFLIGEAVPRGRSGNHLPACAFREKGGEQLCEHVCRRPTEAFCRDALGVPVTLRPSRDAGSFACDWQWGEP